MVKPMVSGSDFPNKTNPLNQADGNFGMFSGDFLRLEHILLRPDTYVGSTEVQHQVRETCWDLLGPVGTCLKMGYTPNDS